MPCALFGEYRGENRVHFKSRYFYGFITDSLLVKGSEGKTMSPITSSPSLDQLVQYLQSIPPDECKLLERTGEYHRVLRSMQFLKQAHQKLHKKAITATTIQAASLLCAPPTSQLQATAAAPTWTSTVTNAPTITPTTNSTLHRTETAPFDEEQDRLSFLQHEAWDDLLHRILEYTECFDLVNVGATCRRLRTLSLYNSTQRCPYVFRQLQHNTMQLLRCAEQMDGVNSHRGPAVPMPLLLPQRRICITECGDFEYNGIYYCTGSNGNGYVFTKPRSPRRWKEGNLLRCLIAKRFSDTVRKQFFQDY